jgi:hypothetical protein
VADVVVEEIGAPGLHVQRYLLVLLAALEDDPLVRHDRDVHPHALVPVVRGVEVALNLPARRDAHEPDVADDRPQGGEHRGNVRACCQVAVLVFERASEVA